MSQRRQAKTAVGGQRAFRRIKVISLGDMAVGKSCLVKRYCEGRFVQKYIVTIGIDFGVKPVDLDGNALRVNFFDFSGHDKFLEIRNEFYRDSEAALLVYDVTRPETFASLDRWLREARSFGAPASLPCIVCGNKADLEQKRKVPRAEAEAWARANGMLYVETSALDGSNVQEAFEALFRSATGRRA